QQSDSGTRPRPPHAPPYRRKLAEVQPDPVRERDGGLRDRRAAGGRHRVARAAQPRATERRAARGVGGDSRGRGAAGGGPRGARGQPFASAADISEFSTHRRDAGSARAYEGVTARAFAALAQFERPVVAVIHGICIGGGLALAATADLRIAADDARVALPA